MSLSRQSSSQTSNTRPCTLGSVISVFPFQSEGTALLRNQWSRHQWSAGTVTLHSTWKTAGSFSLPGILRHEPWTKYRRSAFEYQRNKKCGWDYICVYIKPSYLQENVCIICNAFKSVPTLCSRSFNFYSPQSWHFFISWWSAFEICFWIAPCFTSWHALCHLRDCLAVFDVCWYGQLYNNVWLWSSSFICKVLALWLVLWLCLCNELIMFRAIPSHMWL